ncbi:MAG TPA: EamA family transporter [Acidimicrobiales bacterium]|nr:EamA family transporter [Acidimicrobiales bacterium]
MAAIFALSAAVAYGVGDFLGGVAARRESASAVVLWSHLVGLGMLVAAAPLLGGVPTPHVMAVGAAAGLLGGGGVALFYRGLAVGSMSVVAPVAALLSAAVPVVAGVSAGERPSAAAAVGIAIALGAVVLVSREATPADGRPAGRARQLEAVGLAVAAGLAFGLFFVAVGHAGDNAGIWPLVGARLASVSLFTLLGAAGIVSTAPPRAAVGAAVGCGLLDAGANVLYLLAVGHGLLSVVAVLTALYPAGTVLLARYVLGEHLAPVQRAGLGLAAVAAVLITV